MTRCCYLLLLFLALPTSVHGQYAVFTWGASYVEAKSHSSPQVARLGRGDHATSVDTARHPSVPHVPYCYMHVSVPGKGNCFVDGPYLMPFDSEAPERLLPAIVEHAIRDYWYPDFRGWSAIHGFSSK